MVEQRTTIDVADLMISRVQNLCGTLRYEGFQHVANDLEDTMIELYDRMLPFLASNDYDNPALEQIANDMIAALGKVEKVTELVDFRDRIMQAFPGVNRG